MGISKAQCYISTVTNRSECIILYNTLTAVQYIGIGLVAVLCNVAQVPAVDPHLMGGKTLNCIPYSGFFSRTIINAKTILCDT